MSEKQREVSEILDGLLRETPSLVNGGAGSNPASLLHSKGGS